MNKPKFMSSAEAIRKITGWSTLEIAIAFIHDEAGLVRYGRECAAILGVKIWADAAVEDNHNKAAERTGAKGKEGS